MHKANSLTWGSWAGSPHLGALALGRFWRSCVGMCSQAHAHVCELASSSSWQSSGAELGLLLPLVSCRGAAGTAVHPRTPQGPSPLWRSLKIQPQLQRVSELLPSLNQASWSPSSGAYFQFFWLVTPAFLSNEGVWWTQYCRFSVNAAFSTIG